MNCPNCGTLLPENAKFCGVCGTQLSPAAGAEATQPVEPAQAASGYNPYGAAQDQYAQAVQQTPPMQQMPPQQMPPYPNQPAGVYADASGTAAKTGLSKGVVGAIIAAVVVAVALIVVFVVVKPFGGGLIGSTPEQAYASAFNKITADGAFTEDVDFDMKIDVSGHYSTNMKMHMSLDVQNYDEKDPSKMTATGSGYMEMPGYISGQIPFEVSVKDGVMTMDMGQYGKQSQPIDASDIVTNTEAYNELWDKAKMEGNTITFELNNAEMKELIESSAAGSTGSLDELDNFTFDTMKYTMNLENEKISTDIVLNGAYEEYGTSATLNMTMSMVIR